MKIPLLTTLCNRTYSPKIIDECVSLEALGANQQDSQKAFFVMKSDGLGQSQISEDSDDGQHEEQPAEALGQQKLEYRHWNNFPYKIALYT